MVLFIILIIANNVYEVSRLHVACKGIFAYTLVCLHGTVYNPYFHLCSVIVGWNVQVVRNTYFHLCLFDVG